MPRYAQVSSSHLSLHLHFSDSPPSPAEFALPLYALPPQSITVSAPIIFTSMSISVLQQQPHAVTLFQATQCNAAFPNLSSASTSTHISSGNCTTVSRP